MKRILFMTHKFWPSIGGTQTLAYNLGKRLEAKGYQLTVFTSTSGSRVRDEWIEGMHVIRFRKTGIGVSRPWYVTPGMVRPAITEQFDLTHCFHFVTFQSLLAAFKRRILRTPLVMTASYHPWRGFYEETAVPLVMRSADRVIAQCESERRLLSGFVPNPKIVRIPCGVDRRRFASRPDATEFRRANGILEGEKVILYVGSLSEEKGLPDLLRAMAKVRQEVNTAKLLVIGGSSTDAYSRKREFGASDYVKFLGRMNDSEVTEAYSAADVFAFPSHSESFGIALVEAAAAGLPIVSTKVGVAEEVVRDGYNGFTVAVQSNDFAGRLIDALSSPTMKTDAETHRNLIIDTFDWDTIVGSLANVYDELTG